VSDAWVDVWQSSATVGVILEDGVALPEGMPGSLLSRQIDTWESLTVAAFTREFDRQSVLYVRYGQSPRLILLAGGERLPIFRPNQMLIQSWPDGAEARISALAEQLARVLLVFVPDVVVLEADGVRAETVIEPLRTALAAKPDVLCDPELRFVAVEAIGLAERETLDRLRLRLAEKLLIDAKKDV
jgi:hypothetical protein